MDAFADLKSEFVEQTRSEKFDDPAHHVKPPSDDDDDDDLMRTRRVVQSSHCSSGLCLWVKQQHPPSPSPLFHSSRAAAVADRWMT